MEIRGKIMVEKIQYDISTGTSVHINFFLPEVHSIISTVYTKLIFGSVQADAFILEVCILLGKSAITMTTSFFFF